MPIRIQRIHYKHSVHKDGCNQEHQTGLNRIHRLFILKAGVLFCNVVSHIFYLRPLQLDNIDLYLLKASVELTQTDPD